MGSVNIECREVNDISTRVGKVVFSREMLMKSTEEELLAIFSNLFPLLIQDDHSKGLMEQKAYYGYSPYFRKLEPGTEPPEYTMWFKRTESGKVFFDRFEEVII